jgi:hypothetical protein
MNRNNKELDVLDIKTCPHCNTELLYAAASPEGEKTYSRAIGVEILGEYDGVSFYRCPDCEGTWERGEDI